MAARNLSEIVRKLIIAHLQAELPTAIADVRTDRADNRASSEPPLNSSYFAFEVAAFRAPAIFVVTDHIDFRLAQMGANHINAEVLTHINAVVEDRDKELLLMKAERYQVALHQLLAQKDLISAPDNLKIVILVDEAAFSPEYSLAEERAPDAGRFRKEVSLICRVQLYEQF